MVGPGAAPAPALALFPLNDTFAPKVISLGQRIKIGRQTSAKTVPNERNGYFDTKVLSRQHAEVWEEGGKIWIKDVKSSNGTFINSIRLSPEGVESEPFELHTDDIVEFGIDIVGEDNKTIIHHKVAARCTCILSPEDAQHFSQAFSGGSGGASSHQAPPPPPPGQGGQYPFQQRRPVPPSAQQNNMGMGMGGMGGLSRPPTTKSFDHIFSRLQSELQKSRETAAELNNLAGAMNDIQDHLGGALPVHPHALPPPPPPPAAQRQDSAGSVPATQEKDLQRERERDEELHALRSRIDVMQNWFAAHVEKLKALADDDVGSLRREVEMLRQSQIIQPQQHQQQQQHHQQQQLNGRDGAVSPVARVLESGEDEDDARSVATIMPGSGPQTLEPLPMDNEEQESKADRTRQWTEDHPQQPERPPTPEPVLMEEPSPESSPEQHDDAGWPDEPPPLAQVPAEIKGAIRNDEPQQQLQKPASPLKASPPSSPPTEAAAATGSDSSPPPIGAGMSLRRRGTAKPRARLQPKKKDDALQTLSDHEKETQSTVNASAAAVQKADELAKTLEAVREAMEAQGATIARLEARVVELEARPLPEPAAPAPAVVEDKRVDEVQLAVAALRDEVAGVRIGWDDWKEERERMRKAVELWEARQAEVENRQKELEKREEEREAHAPPSPRSLSGSDDDEKVSVPKRRRRKRRAVNDEHETDELQDDVDPVMLTPSSLSSGPGSVMKRRLAPLAAVMQDTAAKDAAQQQPIARNLTTLMLALCALLLLLSFQPLATTGTIALACAVGLWAAYARGAVAVPAAGA